MQRVRSVKSFCKKIDISIITYQPSKILRSGRKENIQCCRMHRDDAPMPSRRHLTARSNRS